MPSLDNGINIKIGTTADDSGINQVESSLGGMVGGFQDGMKKIGVATAVVGAGLTAFSKSSVNSLSDVVKSAKTLATQTGLTVTAASSLQAAFTKSGVSADKTAASFKIFAKTISNAKDETASNTLANEQLDQKIKQLAITHDTINDKIKANSISVAKYTEEIAKNGDSSGELHNKIAKLNDSTSSYKNQLQTLTLTTQQYQEKVNSSKNPLDQLNISTKNADGSTKSFDTILYSVADKFKTMPDGVDKTALSMRLFGRSGTDMIKVLDKGSDGIKKLEEQAQKLGLTLTTQNIAAISNYTQSQKDLTASTSALKIQVGTLTAPLMTQLNETINKVVSSMISTQAPFHTAVIDILAFGGPVLGAVGAFASFGSNIAGMIPLFEKMIPKIVAMGVAIEAQVPVFATSMGAINAIMSVPFIMPAIVVVAALAALALVVTKALETKAVVEQTQKNIADDVASINKTTDQMYNNVSSNVSGSLSQVYKLQQSNGYSGANKVYKNGGTYTVGFASGTNKSPEGWAWVGEDGPELMKLPGGTQVKGNKESQQAVASGSSSSSGMVNHFTINNNVDVMAALEVLNWKLANG